MTTATYRWRAHDADHELRLVRVPGTEGKPYLFGPGQNRRPVDVRQFHIAVTPVTQALWMHVMGSNPSANASARPDGRHPVENVSWDHINGPGGFLQRIQHLL